MADSANEMEKVKALFFAADPRGGGRLMIGQEIRAITKKIRAAEYRDSIELIPALATQPDDLIETLNLHKPQVVHFSAHGKETGEILLLDQMGFAKSVSPKAIQALFMAMKDNIRVVLLNACYSKVQARAIVKVIDCAIGIKNPISNQAAISFAASFYQAIGFGRSVKDAYEQGRVAILLEGIDKKNIPELLVKDGVDPAQIFLVKAPPPLPEPPPIDLLKQGHDLLEKQKYGEAFAVFQKARESNPGDEEIQFLYCLSFLSGKPILSLKKTDMNEITVILKKIAQGKDNEISNRARIVLGIIWYDYYERLGENFQELFFRENKRYLQNYYPTHKEKHLVNYIAPSESSKILFNLD